MRGYRSFGTEALRLPRLARVNLVIGPNNSGKSNVLRFLYHVYPKLLAGNNNPIDPTDRHTPGPAEFHFGRGVSLERDSTEPKELISPRVRSPYRSADIVMLFARVLRKKAELDSTPDVWFTFDQPRRLLDENWPEAFGVLSDSEVNLLSAALTGHSIGGTRAQAAKGILPHVTPGLEPANVVMIPAIRQIKTGSTTEANVFNGDGLVESLAALERPEISQQADKEKFRRIEQFLRSVTDNPTAKIEVPKSRSTIHVEMDGRMRHLDSLGTGIHEVIILATAATIPDKTVICMEEPEMHLNPVLQRKLVRYLTEATTNQYFISTHSAALMDTPGAEIYHIRLTGGRSIGQRVTSDSQKSRVCEDLGYHPSDLLQANCVIWVEGPSDRVYLTSWLKTRDAKLIEGVHYAIMFYGGRLAAHLSGEDIDQAAVEGFISLLRLNRRAVIVIDSDRKSEGGELNATKRRLVEEFDKSPGYAWVTAGREIENYLQPDRVKKAIEDAIPSAVSTSQFGQYDKYLTVRSQGGKDMQAPKVEVARFVVSMGEIDESTLDLMGQLDKLVKFIRDSNPNVERVSQ